MKPRRRHPWPRSARTAMRLQARLAARVDPSSLDRPVRCVAGADCAFADAGRRIIAAWVVWDVTERRIVERAHAVRRVTFPYVPGLLSFREAPALVAAAARLRSVPDVLMLDGHGLAHPRRFGLACHLGVLFDRPSVGCAKSLLCGEFVEPRATRGAREAMTDNGERIGAVLRTRDGVKPVFVSTGHRCSLDDAVEIVLGCGGGFRLPEPTRQADQYVAELKRGAAASPSPIRSRAAGGRRR